MGVAYNPAIVTSGLVLCLDAGNPKGYDKYENLVRKSEDLTIAAGFWTEVSDGVTVTTNQAIAPDGTLTADKVAIKNTNSGGKAIQGSVLSPSVTGQAYTASIFCKAAEHSYVRVDMEGAGNPGGIVVDLSNGSLISQVSAPDSYSIQSYSNGWYRIAATSTAVSTAGSALRVYLTDASGNSLFSGTTGNGVYMWGGQFEAASGVTDYYPTTGTAKNRGSTLIDLSGNGNNGTLTNGPTYSSSNGGSLSFDGVDDYVDFTSEPDLNGKSFSAGCWFKTTDTSMRLIQNCDTGSFGTKNGFQVSVIDNTFGNIGVTDSSGNFVRFDTVSSTPYTDGNWHFVCLTFNTSTGTAELYLDGIFSADGTDSGLIGANMNGVGLEIGRANSSTQYLNGNISYASIYNKALTAAEIQQNFNALRGRFNI